MLDHGATGTTRTLVEECGAAVVKALAHPAREARKPWAQVIKSGRLAVAPMQTEDPVGAERFGALTVRALPAAAE